MSRNVEMIPASLVYRRYGIPRGLLRKLAEDGTIRQNEACPTPYNVFKTYCVEDIERFLSGH